MGDTLFLEKNYQAFLNFGPPEVKLGEEYMINFAKMIQFSIKNEKRQRPIKRDLPKNVINIVRKNRLDCPYQQENCMNLLFCIYI